MRSMRSKFRNGAIALVCALGVLDSAHAMAEELLIEAKPAGMDEKQSKIVADLLLNTYAVKKRLQGSRYRILQMHVSESAPEKERSDLPETELQIFDYTRNEMLRIASQPGLGDPLIETVDTAIAPPIAPAPEEYEEALELVRSHPEFSQREMGELWEPYEAMPGVIDGNMIEPRFATHRIISLGLRPVKPEFQHEIVGVDLSTRQVIRFPEGAPPTTRATLQACAPPNAWQGTIRRGTSGQAEIIVRDGTTVVWKFLVTRPSASGGYWGSGIDIRRIEYRGKPVISQIHLPILNVLYDYNRCGPYRDWQYSESPFESTGTAIAPGIQRASQKPRTIFESGSDRGNFFGVSIYTEGGDTYLVSEVMAGWYRYKSEFRFSPDGTIRPRWGFGAIQDSCTCNRHHHHAYFRIDFDVGAASAKNRAQVSADGSSWRDIPTESRMLRNSQNRLWRVIDPATQSGYIVEPGPADGIADSYGRGDVWLLKFQRYQTDDSRVYRSTAIGIDSFVNGESIQDQDLVFWYAGHFIHDADSSPHFGHFVGPTLRPVGLSPSE